jgi:hypothetical protein
MKSYLQKLWSDTRLPGGLSASILLGAAACVPSLEAVRPLMGMVLFILLFTMYDAVGWGTGIHWPGRWHDRLSVAPYRLIQHAFMISLVVNTGLLFGWRCAAAGLIAWWFGACDVLFYPLLRQPLPVRGPDDRPYHFHWMERWSAHRVVRWMARGAGLSYACRRPQLVAGALLGLLTGALLCLWSLVL